MLTGINYGWGVSDNVNPQSFICEIPLSSVRLIVKERRDFGKLLNDTTMSTDNRPAWSDILKIIQNMLSLDHLVILG